MADVQFGFVMPAEWRDTSLRSSYVEQLNRALASATGHFDSAWIVDHLQFGTTDVLESFTTLAYMAALHPGLKFGHAVLCQSFRNPALLAKMAATLQFMSGGRFMLGLGAGWHAEEYHAYGYNFPSNRVRVEQLAEAIQVIKALWSQEQATFAGKHYHITNATCEPRPNPAPPIMIGAFKPKMLQLAAQYADCWNVSSTGINTYQHMLAAFERACAAINRDPATIQRSWVGGCACAPTQAEADTLAGDRLGRSDDDFDLIGTPDQLIEQMIPFIDAGINCFILDCAGFPQLGTLELMINTVIPKIKAL